MMEVEEIERAALYFEKAEEFRQWLDIHAETKDELWVGYFKKSSKKKSIDWPTSVDEALCFGWIDGVRRSIDDERYAIRFTRRRAGSHWSKVNVAKVEKLKAEGKMKVAGMKAYHQRSHENTGRASFEQPHVSLLPVYQKQLNSSKKAKAFFERQAPHYRKACIHWIMSAKQEKTQLNRLQTLIDCCTQEEKIPPLRWAAKK